MLVRDSVARAAPLGRGLGVLIHPLIVLDPVVCWDLADRDLVVSGVDASACLNGGDGEVLSRSDGVRPSTADGRGGIHKTV